MSVTNLTFTLDGIQIDPPVEWQGMEITLDYSQEVIQPVINTEEFTFAGTGYEKIKAKADDVDGPGLFEASELIIGLSNGIDYVDFEALLDFRSGLTLIAGDAPKAKCRIIKKDGLDNLAQRAESVSFGYLDTIRNNNVPFFISSDYRRVPYVVDKFDTGTDKALLTLSLSFTTYQLYDIGYKQRKDVIAKIKIILSPPLDKPAEIADAIATVLLTIAYTASLIISLVKLMNELFSIYAPPLRYLRGITLQRAIEKAMSYLGYEFVTDIVDMSRYVYLPSKPNEKKNKNPKGIPDSGDYGYMVSEMMQICRDCFNGKFAVVEENGKQVVHFHSLNSPFWQKSSTYILNDTLQETYDVTYNLEELQANRLLYFLPDSSDQWTVENFTGTNFEIITTPKGFANYSSERKKKVQMQGLNSINIGLALGNPKLDLSDLDLALLQLAGAADLLLQIGFQRPKYARLITNKLGALKISDKQFYVPKLLSMSGEVLENRGRLSAKYLMNTFYSEKSFDPKNQIGGQFQLFKGIKIPFDFSDYTKVVQNRYFTTRGGKEGRFDVIKWNIEGGYAEVDYRVKHTYTNNIQEIPIEP